MIDAENADHDMLLPDEQWVRATIARRRKSFPTAT
jgi:hypothetical protein